MSTTSASQISMDLNTEDNTAKEATLQTSQLNSYRRPQRKKRGKRKTPITPNTIDRQSVVMSTLSSQTSTEKTPTLKTNNNIKKYITTTENRTVEEGGKVMKHNTVKPIETSATTPASPSLVTYDTNLLKEDTLKTNAKFAKFIKGKNEGPSFADMKKKRRNYYSTHKSERMQLNKLYAMGIKQKYETLNGWKARIEHAHRLSILKTIWSCLFLMTSLALITISLIIVFQWRHNVKDFDCKVSPYLYTGLAVTGLEIILLPAVIGYLFFAVTYATQDGIPTYCMLYPIGSCTTLTVVIYEMVIIGIELFFLIGFGFMNTSYASECIPEYFTRPWYYVNGFFAGLLLLNVVRIILFCLYFVISKCGCITRGHKSNKWGNGTMKKKKKKKRGPEPDNVRSVHVSTVEEHP